MFEISDVEPTKVFVLRKLTDKEQEFLDRFQMIFYATHRAYQINMRNMFIDTAVTMEAVERFLSCLK